MEDSQYTYTFPIGPEEGSIQFHVDNATVLKATLEVNGIKLSVVKPSADGSRTSLKFFNERPFHRGLIPNCDVNIILVLSDERVPSLIMEVTDEHITVDQYSELVVTSGEDINGNIMPRKMKLLYAGHMCGFLSTDI